MRVSSFTVALLAGIFAASSTVFGADEDAKDEAAKPVSFYSDIRPVFQVHCYGCHQPAKQMGSLDMTSLEALRKGGDSEEPAVTPGDLENSTLVEMITPAGRRAEMPKNRPPLAADQIALIRRWIAEGAKDDTPQSAAQRYSQENPPTYKLPPVLTSIDYSPDGRLLAVSGYHEILLHKADGSELVARLVGLSERIQSVRFSPDGKWLAAAGGLPGRLGEIQIWDVDRRKLKLAVNVTYDTLYGASWSHDGKMLAFGCGDSTLRAINTETGKEVFYQRAHNDWVLDTVFAVDASHLVSVSRDRSMKLNQVATQRFVDNITSITPGALKGGLNAVDRHPAEDKLLTGGADGTPKIYKMHRTKARKIGDDFNLIRKCPEMPGRIFDVAFNHDGTRIVAGSSLDGAGHVWVMQEKDAKVIAKLEGVRGGVYCVAFSPDGNTVASGGFAGEILLNDAATGKLFKSFVPVPLENDE